MRKLSERFLAKCAKYTELSSSEKKKILNKLYIDRKMSWKAASDLCNTYPNRLKRDAAKFDISSRSKSEAQSVALSSGRHKHPTKGKGHSAETKIKISDAVHTEYWAKLSDEEKEQRRETARKIWNEKSPEEIAELRRAAGEGIRRAAKDGSVLEKYLLKGLIESGYKVEFHKEHWVIKQKMQIDLFIPEHNVAIEVDGPSHFEPVWGEEVLAKNKRRDNEKNGLLLQRGCVIIRIRQSRGLSERFKRDSLKKLLGIIEVVKTNRPKVGNRCIIIGDDNE